MTDDSSRKPPAPAPALPAPPPPIGEYASNCVRYVKSAVGIALDYCAETLPVLDHYLRESRASVRERPESLPLLAATVGAYLGELLRHRYSCAWILEGDNALEWKLDVVDLPVRIFPVAMAHVALTGDLGDEAPAVLAIDGQSRELVARRLASLPAVSDDEFVAPSTRVEAVDIAIETVRAHLAHSRPS